MFRSMRGALRRRSGVGSGWTFPVKQSRNAAGTNRRVPRAPCVSMGVAGGSNASLERLIYAEVPSEKASEWGGSGPLEALSRTTAVDHGRPAPPHFGGKKKINAKVANEKVKLVVYAS